jgi:transcriptional regulator with XRE-family HTH domain
MTMRMADRTFRDRFLVAFAASGMSVADLARQSGVPYHAIDKLKKREGASTSADNAAKLARALGIDGPRSSDEETLLELYGQLTAEERVAVLATAEGLLARRDRR